MWVEGRGHLPGQLIVVSGPSGCGKSTVIRGALGRADLDVQLSVSATTRERRPGERDGVDYYFMDRDAFRGHVDRDEFLEWAEYNANLYGTPAVPVFDALAAGRSVILEIDVRGALQIRHLSPTALFVFIKVPDFRTLERRLRLRGTEDEPAILRRLRKAREELAEAHWYDVQLVNDELDRCVQDFIIILKTYGCGG
jgi:guanylate kinase